MSRPMAIFLVVLSALGFGSIAMFAKMAYASGVTPSTLLALRFVLAMIMVAPVIWLKGLSLPRGRALAGYILMGSLYTGQAQSYFTALLYASSGLVALLLYIYPVLVTVLSLFLGWEKWNKRILILLTMACLGLAITLGGKLQGQPLGIFLGILASMIYAVYILIGKRLSEGTHPLAATFVILASAGCCNSILALYTGVSFPHNISGWFGTGAIALFSTVLSIAAFLTGVKVIGAAQASILSTLEPVMTIAIGLLLFGETSSINQTIGGAIVLITAILLARNPSPEAENMKKTKLITS